MATQIQFRRGTAAAWTAANPVLTAGEPGFETDTGKWKVGDGTTAWTVLSYSVPDLAAHLSDATDAHDASAISVAAITGVSGSDAQAVLEDLKDQIDSAGGGSGLPKFRTGRWYDGTYGGGVTPSNADPVQGRLYATPFEVGEAVTFDRIGVNVIAAYGAGGVMRLGIATDTGDAYPNAITDFGTVAIDTTGAKEITISHALTPGLYWLISAVQGGVAAGTMNTIAQSGPNFFSPVGWAAQGTTNGQIAYQTTGSTGAFPATYPGGISSTTSGIPRVMIRAA